MTPEFVSVLDEHLACLVGVLPRYRQAAARLSRWGRELADVLGGGGRLLVAGNGGSAAEAQHLAAELVGRFRDERRALSVIALTAESASVTAISNDYGYQEVFARQVRAHGRATDALLLMSSSGRSPNLLTAAEAGAGLGMRVFGFTGAAPNPLADVCHDALAVPAPDPQVVQELHLVAVHILCEHIEQSLPADAAAPRRVNGTAPDAVAPADLRRWR